MHWVSGDNLKLEAKGVKIRMIASEINTTTTNTNTIKRVDSAYYRLF